MKYEYELHKNIRAKQNFINWTSSIMLNCIYGVEILNDKYDPFSLKLTGWSEQINADISSYYDIFGEIYEKYNKPGKSMSPELRIILMLGGSALKFHLNKIAISNSSNNHSSEKVQDPKLLEQMRQQALIDRMREDSVKQNDSLKKKIDDEHVLANQQMKDMMFLQQKQQELKEQEEINKKKMADFERVRMMMETNKKQDQNRNVDNSNKNTDNQYVNQNVNDILNNAFGGGQRFNGNTQNLADQRKSEITQQLQEMKKNINNLNIESKELDKSSERTSSTSDQTTSSSSPRIQKSSKKEITSLLSNGDKSTTNSKTNQSTFSKRKYKKSGISIDTA